MNQPIKGMAKGYPFRSNNPAFWAGSIETDRMNLLFTMTNNQRQPNAFAQRTLKLLFLPDEEVDLKAAPQGVLARSHIGGTHSGNEPIRLHSVSNHIQNMP